MITTSDPAATLQLTRRIKGSRNAVYHAWTNLDTARRWWGPEGCETHELLLQAHPKGKLKWVLSAPDGERMTAQGEFRELRPGEGFTFTWQWADDPIWADTESLVTVEFKQLAPRTTEVCLTHEGLPTQRSRDNHIGGWNSSLDKLQQLIESEIPVSANLRPV